MCAKYLLACLLACLAVPCAGAVPEDVGQLEQQAFRAAVDRVAPSVVRIETIGGLERVEDVLFGTGPTTGLVVDPDGYIISSAFNFLNRPTQVLVRLPGETRRRAARLVATDHNRMLVLLKIDVPKPLPVPEIVPEKEMRVGQWAIAVGRAFEGDRPNMSVGLLSAVGRIWGKAIQTDAAISPNNYGGPLVDIRGRVLGVLVPLSPQADSEVSGVEWYDSGIGFAVAAAHIQAILPRLKKGEDLHPGLIGIGFRGHNLHTSEPIISSVHPQSPAEAAGLKRGDRIVEIEGQAIARAAQVKEQLSRRYAGQKIRIVVERDKQRIQRQIELAAHMPPYDRPFLGILPLRIASATRAAGGKAAASGVTVRYVYPGGPAEKAHLQAGDVLVALEGAPIQDPADLLQEIAALRPGATVHLEVRRSGQVNKVSAELGRVPEGLPPRELPPARPSAKPTIAGAGELAGRLARKILGPRPPVGTVPLKIAEFPNDAWAYVPDAYDPAIPHGILVWLHGPEGLEPADVTTRWKRLCDRFDLILVAPKAADPAKWQTSEATLLGKLLADVASRYNVDPQRVAVCGREGAGTLAYYVAFHYREGVRAVAAIDAYMADRPPAGDALHPLGFFVAKADGSRLAGLIDEGVARLRELKYPVTLKSLGQQPRALDAEELAELVRWIDTLDRI